MWGFVFLRCSVLLQLYNLQRKANFTYSWQYLERDIDFLDWVDSRLSFPETGVVPSSWLIGTGNTTWNNFPGRLTGDRLTLTVDSARLSKEEKTFFKKKMLFLRRFRRKYLM